MSFQEERGSGVYNNRTYDVPGNTRPTSISIPTGPPRYDEEQVSPLSEHGSDLSRAFSDRSVSNPNSHVVSVVGPAAPPVVEHDDSDNRSIGGDREAQPGDNLVSHFREHDQTETRLVEEPSVEKSGYAALGEHKRESWVPRMLKSRKRRLIVGVLVLIILLLVVLVPVLVVTLRNRNNRGDARRYPGVAQPQPTESPDSPGWRNPPSLNGTVNDVLRLTGLSQGSDSSATAQRLFYQSGNGTVKMLEFINNRWETRNEDFNIQDMLPGSPLASISPPANSDGTEIEGVKMGDSGTEQSTPGRNYNRGLEQPRKRQDTGNTNVVGPDQNSDVVGANGIGDQPPDLDLIFTASSQTPSATEFSVVGTPSAGAVSPLISYPSLASASVMTTSSESPDPTGTWETHDAPRDQNISVPTLRNVPLVVVGDGILPCNNPGQKQNPQYYDNSPLTIFTTGKDGSSLRQYPLSEETTEQGWRLSIRSHSNDSLKGVKGTAGLALGFMTDNNASYLVGHSDNEDQPGLVLLMQSANDPCEWVYSESLGPPDIEILEDGILCAVDDSVVHQRNDGSIWAETIEARGETVDTQGESGKSQVTWAREIRSREIVSRDKEVMNGTGLACGTAGDSLNHYVVYQNQAGYLKQAFWRATNVGGVTPAENDVWP